MLPTGSFFRSDAPRRPRQPIVSASIAPTIGGRGRAAMRQDGKLGIMKIATWNVNSLRVRLGHVLTWLQANPVDVLGIQETKLTDDKFPTQELIAAGYHVHFAGQATYNGVALLTRLDTIGAPNDVVVGNPLYPDPQQRLITATCKGIRISCAYIPNGQEVGSEKYSYKLAWLDALIQWMANGADGNGLPRVLMGDFNIAPADVDVHNPNAWKDQVLCSVPERQRYEQLVNTGLVDSFRLFEQAEKIFSWWDYRRQGFRRNAGLRIDLIMVDQVLKNLVTSCAIDREPRSWEQPSDHAPVVTTLQNI